MWAEILGILKLDLPLIFTDNYWLNKCINKEYNSDGLYNTNTYSTNTHSTNSDTNSNTNSSSGNTYNSNNIFDSILYSDDDVYDSSSNSNNMTSSSSSSTSSSSTSFLTDLFHQYTHWKMMLIGEAGACV